MKIVIAPDSFKGSLTAKAAAAAIAEGVNRADATVETVQIPLADGGEGTAQTLCDATGGQMHAVMVKDPLLREVTAQYAVLGDGITAVIEMAEASGLPILTKAERNPRVTSTFGTGQLIRAALDRGCRRFVVAIGGSATNDGGAGMMSALGVVFRDGNGQGLPPGGGSLDMLREIDMENMDSRLAESAFVAACDVDNPLCGPRGASAVFGPQKGASAADVAHLDNCLAQYGRVLEAAFGRHIADIPGAGAAGGMGAALNAFLRSEMESGAEIVKKEVRFVQALAGADLLITGEGFIDFQTLAGKTPYAAAIEAKRRGIPAVAICGGIGTLNDAFDDVFTSVFSIVNRPMDLAEATENAYALLAEAAYRVVRLLCR